MEKIKFNQGWKVWKDLDPFELVFRVPDEAIEVDLPYDAMFHEEQKQGAVNGGFTGNIDAGEYKYYKRFFIPEEYRGGHVMLQFEGIYRNASVFVNQSKVGGSAYGYTDFTVEAGDYLKYGEENEVLVTVKWHQKQPLVQRRRDLPGCLADLWRRDLCEALRPSIFDGRCG